MCSEALGLQGFLSRIDDGTEFSHFRDGGGLCCLHHHFGSGPQHFPCILVASDQKLGGLSPVIGEP